MNMQTWVGRLVGAGLIAAAVAACSSSTTGDDTTDVPPGTDAGPGGGSGGDGSPGPIADAEVDSGDASPYTQVTGDAGQCLSNCHEGQPCTVDSTCASGVCTAGACSDPSCTDGKMDGTETATDCGGICNACADGLGCLVGADCTSFVCDGAKKVCDAPTATDGVMNGTETDKDCGDSGTGEPDNAPACADGKKCLANADCVDKECGTNHTCLTSSCSDGIQNGTETGLDCGGTCNPCADGVGCKVNADCTSKSCDTVADKCLAPTDKDKIQNGNETDVDCGSSGTGEATHAPACADKLMCGNGTDCIDLVCANGTCSAPSCSDGVKNGSETGKDCGDNAVTGCVACADGVGCNADSDCTSESCNTTTHLCLAPTSVDGIQNGNESDVDCGSSGTGEKDSAPACPDINATTKKISVCAASADCLSTFCNTSKSQCVDGQSCSLPAAAKASIIHDISKQSSTTVGGADATGTANANGAGLTAGVDTCGVGEATDAPASRTLESCCKSLDVTVPDVGAVRVDKYEVTAGRMRQFVEAVSAEEVAAKKGAYNIQQWVSDQIAAKTPAGVVMAAQFPIGADGTTNTVSLFPTSLTGTLSLAYQVGATTLDDGYPSYEQGCYMGGEYSYAASTYWFDSADSENAVYSPPRAFTQDYYDIKSQNCIPYWMTVAFCAWDGGSLPTQTELDYLWGSSTYPWGDQDYTYADIGAPPKGTAITNWVVNNLNDDSANVPASQTFFYQYPEANLDTAASPSNPGTGPLSYKSIIDTTSLGYDNTPWIAAPGRFPLDATALKATGAYSGDAWYDLAANMIEFQAITDLTSNDGQFCDTSEGESINGTTCPAPYNCIRNTGINGVEPSCGTVRGANMPNVVWKGGSWEVHGIGKNSFNEPMQTQYGKTGFRCARPVE